MTFERKYNWQEEVARIDGELGEALRETVARVVLRESEIPRKYKELILMACSAAIRYGSSVRRHGIEAMYFGATDREVVEALSLASMSAGMTALIEGVEALGDQLTSQPPRSDSESVQAKVEEP